MSALILVTVLVAGFYACHIHPVHSYKLHRYEGQYLYLKSAELGVFAFAIASVLPYLVSVIIPTITIGDTTFKANLDFSLDAYFINNFGFKDDVAAELGWMCQQTILTFVSAYLLKIWGLLKLYWRFGQLDCKVFVIGEILKDSPLDKFLFDLSFHDDKLIMLSMDDRKVYVGSIKKMAEPSETSGLDQEITITVTMSGYRNEYNMKVKFTTFYGDVDDEIDLILRQKSIVSASEFNFDAYETWYPSAQSK